MIPPSVGYHEIEVIRKIFVDLVGAGAFINFVIASW